MVVEGLELQASPPNRPSKRKEGLEVELISKDQFLIIHDYVNSVSIKSQNEAFKELQVGDLEGVRNIVYLKQVRESAPSPYLALCCSFIWMFPTDSIL